MIFLICSLLSLHSSHSKADTHEYKTLKPTTVQLSWKFQFQFAQIIAAYEKGYYRNAGLDVTIIEGGPGINAADEVSNGQADFGVYSSALIVEYSRRKPVVALAALMQHSAVGLAVQNNESIQSIHDLKGKTVTLSSDTYDEILAYFKANGLNEGNVHIKNKTATGLINLRDAQGISIYTSNEAFLIKDEPNKYQLFSPRSAGIDLFGNILFTSSMQIKQDLQKVKAFREATLRGLDYALNHQEEIIDLILEKYNTQNKTREHLQFEARKIHELTRPDIVEPGYMSRGRWKHVAEVYSSLGKIPEELDLTPFLFNPDPHVNMTPFYWAIGITMFILALLSGFLMQSRHFNRQLQTEIAERQQAESLLRESEARFKELFDNNPDPCWIIENNHFIECNQAAANILEYPDKQALAATHPSQVSPEFQPDKRPSKEKADEMISIALKKGLHRFEWIHQKLNGQTIPVEVTLAKTNFCGREVLYCVWRDITERKRIDKLKDEFVSTVSHEIRTPLTSIRGSLGLLNGGVAGTLSEKGKTLIDISLKNTERLLLLINDLLDMSKMESGKMEYCMEICDIRSLVEQAVRANEHFASQHQTRYTTSNAAANMFIWGDSNRLIQVLNNLLSNAAKFSEKTSEINISTEQNHGNVVIKVHNFGQPIPEDFRARIFEKFTQADSSDNRKIGGTGLGLSIANSIIQDHKGSISFTSSLDNGTEFQVSLPEYIPKKND